MTRITLNLMDTYLFGRDLQNALLAFIYEDAEPGLKKVIDTAIRSNTLDLDESELKELASLVKNSIGRIHGEKPVPTLYQAGIGDSKILSKVGLKKGVSWQEFLVSYFDEIVSRGVSNTGDLLKPCKYPMLTKAYIFSYTRSMDEVEDTDCLSVVLAMAGAYISLVTQLVVTRAYDDKGKRMEIYIVPDGSLKSIRSGSLTYSILLAEWLDPEKPPSRLSSLIRHFTDIGGSSPDISLLLAILSHVLFYKDRVGTSIEPEIFNGYRLVKIDIEGRRPQRPQIMWSTPLTMISKVLASEETSSRLAWVLRELSELASSKTSEVRDAVGVCLGSVYRYIETWSMDQLVECASGLSRLLSSSSIQGDVKRRIEGALRAISRLT